MVNNEGNTQFGIEDGRVPELGSAEKKEKDSSYYFLKRYYSGRYYLTGLSETARDIFEFMAFEMDLGSNIIKMDKFKRKSVMRMLGIKERMLDRKIGELLESKLLRRRARSIYVISPWVYGYGNKARNVKLRLEYLELFGENKI